MHIKTKLLATALGLTLAAAPAFAQQSTMPMQSQGGAMGGSGMSSGTDMRDSGMHHDGMRGHRRAERRAERAENRMNAAELVQEASAALRRGRIAEANELIEQSETRLLTRSTPADRAEQPASGPVLQHLSAARNALRSRDRSGAQQELDQALSGLQAANSRSGSNGMGMAPTQGSGMGGMRQDSMGGRPMGGSTLGSGPMGSPRMGPGGQTMMDGGSAGSSMSRADGIIRVQAGSSSGSGGLSGSSPGSPGVGNPGSLPGTGAAVNGGSGAGGRALPGSSAAGVGAPPPGGTSGTPQMSGTGRSSSGGAVSTGLPSSGTGGNIPPGSSQSGGGTGNNPGR
ncbi:hypothetical protein JMJ55_22655 [Belnapia sp. T6]|uniref:Uncharacterized protein n=1 Tax=Belnapia mucosa TaxID=2804532 RepID=A0ABS1V900_9PROT|nr:hypothetical protein [Belnapia mucosa]MBL6458143.1 hypothetical protein [Belnapia mucosa]